MIELCSRLERCSTKCNPVRQETGKQARFDTMSGADSTGDQRRERAGRRAVRGRKRTQLSLDVIIETAIAQLDDSGAERFTIRGLAAALGTGPASIYWYAASKEELLQLLSDELIGRCLNRSQRLRADGQLMPPDFLAYPSAPAHEQTDAQTYEALCTVRGLILCLLVEMQEHRWLAGQMIDDGPDGLNSLQFWELTGQQLQRMPLEPEEQFHASLALVNYASGMGAESAHRAREIEKAEDVPRLLEQQLQVWRDLDEERFPFVRSMVGIFGKFDDISEFISGLDLILAGIERQTWGRR